jgi:hypothetical protein
VGNWLFDALDVITGPDPGAYESSFGPPPGAAGFPVPCHRPPVGKVGWAYCVLGGLATDHADHLAAHLEKAGPPLLTALEALGAPSRASWRKRG